MLKASQDAAAGKRFVIQVRVTKEQKETFEDAAAKCGQDVSNWVRGIALEKARELGVK